MPKYSSLAFRLSFNGTCLIADPRETETMQDAMTRTIEKHAGCKIVELGRCKRAGENYRYPVVLTNGTRGQVFVEGNVR